MQELKENDDNNKLVKKSELGGVYIMKMRMEQHQIQQNQTEQKMLILQKR